MSIKQQVRMAQRLDAVAPQVKQTHRVAEVMMQ